MAPKCYTAGDHDGLTEMFHLLIIYLLATTCVVEIILSVLLVLTQFRKRYSFLKKFKLFMVPLIVTDFFIGCIFSTLFILELSKEGEDVDCEVSASRIVMYTYYYATRLVALLYICFLTYKKTRETLPTPTQKNQLFTFVINVSLLWSPGIASIICFGFSSVETNSILASLTCLYIIFAMSSSCFCYFLVYRAIVRDKNYEDITTFTDTKYYRNASHFVKVSFICFLAINIPLLLCSVIFVAHTFAPDHSKENRLLQDLYLVSIALTAIQSMGNPIFFVNRVDKVRKGLLKSCCIIMFQKEVEYKGRFRLSFVRTLVNGEGSVDERNETNDRNRSVDDIVNGDDSVDGENIVDGEDIVYRENIVDGEDIVYRENIVDGEDIVYRDNIVEGDDIVYGDDTNDNVVDADPNRVSNDVTLATENGNPGVITPPHQLFRQSNPERGNPEPEVFGNWRHSSMQYHYNVNTR